MGDDDDDDLFTIAAKGGVRHSDPSTSHEAADETDTARLERKAWTALKADGRWLTYFQWSEVSGIKYSSITPRGKSLWTKGLVEREKREGVNDLGKSKPLMHFRAKQP